MEKGAASPKMFPCRIPMKPPKVYAAKKSEEKGKAIRQNTGNGTYAVSAAAFLTGMEPAAAGFK